MKVTNIAIIENVFNLCADTQFHYSSHHLHCYKRYNTLFVKITKSDNQNDSITMWHIYVIEEVSPLNFIKRFDLSKGMLFKDEMIKRLKEIIKESWK